MELYFDQPTSGDILSHRQGLKRRRLARLPIYRERSKGGAPPFSPLRFVPKAGSRPSHQK